ncbi:similar to Saccharomyces cerevisiae YDL225W SHS1 One of five related septins (Cdc3p, Cdc10p, Cdc11p, Cdc12p, Shs1p) [Maudiozyma barnettii]|uniref:Similar to Saccharomyces cerevisiae YDL225W SHS1 One of five related septins (Cdc3p, Cdc10p, Cdc11p, Cdc12p, Shs1p) n=1 Tax=Maudiozyma barnettii TaxID=61262 RepID=A0A8H2VIM6_9SACH|nr:septin SHS1 [Kazachstania barnettii]CAB4255944.1 similar to Saccharomyces cerevisiae YDL225W SHS1 One of five related septins (Cdc3p, Cdc10p, Cdc11p, Cdc12p, Shs1p) [Kazachstania barnettii]CAD1784504.1 similar to Saccharomyces cerevisiae YDL225W SHS1 One of five related septins (Cdc3p, Cdc10p, Cdc11p, Cdc12p, Shs1p) [Kazachstania barnettii]
MESPVPSSLFRRKKDNRRGITYTIMMIGATGTGKTSFANNLVESNIFAHEYNQNLQDYQISPKIKISSPTKVVSFNSKNGIPSYMNDFDPNRANLESGITITSTSLEISTGNETVPAVETSPVKGHRRSNSIMDEEEDTIFLNLVNTHGITENLDDTLCFDEITSYLEQQFDIVLSEETRIRRNPRFEDTRVHIALYFIEPSGHGLKEMDVEIMKRVARYTNVLPIISKADSFTKDELKQFKQNIMNDIERYNVPIYKFEVDTEEDDLEAIEENQALSALQPFSIISSDERNKEGKYIRSYPWGTLQIDDDKISDLRILKSVMFGSHLQEFKDTTQNLLYENYRTDKLSSVTKNADPEGQIKKGNKTIGNRESAAPSLSNFASLINTGHFKSSQSLATNSKLGKNDQTQLPTTPQINNNENGNDRSDTNESPIKQMSDDIRNGNEEIIRSIKKEAQSNETVERNKLRNISETVPYVLRHERIIARQQKLEELEAQSAKELQKRIQELEKKAHDLKLRERLIKQQGRNLSSASITSDNKSFVSTRSMSQSQMKKNDTFTDLASIVSGKE